MTTMLPVSESTAADWPDRIGRGLWALAFAVLLACLAARCFLGELPFHRTLLRPAAAYGGSNAWGGPGLLIDRTELARLSFAVLLGVAIALWLAGSALSGRLTVRGGWLGWLILAFSILALGSAWGASDKRGAMNGWIEQLTLLWAGWVALQLCGDRRRFVMLVIVLLGVGAALAVKGLWQEFVEVPDNIVMLEMYHRKILTAFGHAAGEPQARMLEARIRAGGATGFFGLANLLGSVMILMFLAVAGLAADKIIFAVRSRKATPSPRRPGQVHLPTLAAALTAGAAVLCGATLILTRSRGAILAAAAAAFAAAIIFIFRRRLMNHWRRAVLVVAAVFLLGVVATVSYGLKFDRLPTKAMTFRWFYWTASAQIVRDHPLGGIGPGNFGSAYLRYRRGAAAEAVKMPHNVFAAATAQYGLGGGLCYLGALACLLVGIARPRTSAPSPPLSSTNRSGGLLLGLAVVVVAVFLARVVFTHAATNIFLFLFEAVIPTVVLGLMLALACWAGRGMTTETVGYDVSRITLGCGVAGFALHNMVTFSLWAPAAGLVFWTAGGAVLARSGGGKTRNLSAVRWPLAIAALAGVAAISCLLWLPVWRKTLAAESMILRLQSRDIPGAIYFAEQAADADRLDAVPAAEAARVSSLARDGAGWADGEVSLVRAYHWACEAIRRDPADYSCQRLAGRVAWRLRGYRPHAGQSALVHMGRAVQLDPMDIRLRLEYARLLSETARWAECLEQLRRAEQIDRLLLDDSLLHLTADEREEIASLKARAGRQEN